MKTYRTKTFSQRKEDIVRQWHLLDAKNQVLGDFASQIAVLLSGKNKATYTPSQDNGDYVVIINASHIAVTGNKAENKLYRRHSNYPGGFKEETFSELLKRQPESIIIRAVKGMLPANRHRDAKLARLKIFANDQHTYQNYIKD